MKIVSQLSPIGEELLKIGASVGNLPEYEAAVDEFMYITKTTLSNVETRVNTLEKQMVEMTARTVRTNFKTKVTYPNNKATLTLTIKNDDKADGYILKVNGKKSQLHSQERRSYLYC
jgi:hypothetical protein